jgi:hypothetical protein
VEGGALWKEERVDGGALWTEERSGRPWNSSDLPMIIGLKIIENACKV